MPHPDLAQVKTPLALAIDIGSSSVRALLFDADGAQIRDSEHRERYKLEITPDGGSMCDPLRLRQLTARCVARVCQGAAEHIGSIGVVGISCHWHSLMGLDAAGTPVTPVYMWSDRRSASDADALQAELVLNDVHARTGCRLHSSYWPAKLHWLHRTRTQIADNVNTWCGLSDWLFAADGGPITTSVSMASATGLLNTAAVAWDRNLLAHLGIDEHRLPTIIDRTTALDPHALHPDLVPEGLTATWYPVVGDGGAANIGAGAIGADRIALTIGTSGAIRLARERQAEIPLPPGLFRYLIDTGTEVIGGALSNGGNMVAWLSNLTQSRDREVTMRQASKLPPDGHGLTVLPFFAGERAPSWHDHGGGGIVGLNLDTTHVHITRAMLEATGHRFARVYAELQSFATPAHTIVANGGALLQSPLWSQIVADTLNHEIRALHSRTEASARGVAIGALQAAGILPSLRTDPSFGARYAPDATAADIYQRARRRLESLEAALTQWEHDTL